VHYDDDYWYTLGSFSVSAGNVLDFKASYTSPDWHAEIALLSSTEGISVARSETDDDGGSMVIIYREKVSSYTTFWYKFYSTRSATYNNPYDYWGYKIYDGSSYHFYE